MRRLLAFAVAAPLIAVGILVMRERLENRPDPIVPGTESVVRFRADVYDAPQPRGAVVEALWHVCNQTVASQLVDLDVLDGGVGVATVAPALGPHQRRRLTGCLQDATIDRVRGELLSITDQPAPP
jgi:hypothetical protein